VRVRVCVSNTALLITQITFTKYKTHTHTHTYLIHTSSHNHTHTHTHTHTQKGSLLELHMFRWAFGHLDKVLPVWLAMFSSSFSIVFLFNSWRAHRLSKRLYYYIYTCVQFWMLVLPAIAVWRMELPPASGLIVLCEQVRFMMKMRMFMCVCVCVHVSLYLFTHTLSLSPPSNSPSAHTTHTQHTHIDTHNTHTLILTHTHTSHTSHTQRLLLP